MSCQPRPHPHASGTAATRASRGTTTNRPIRKRSTALLGSGSMSGTGTRRVTRGGLAVVVSGVAVIVAPRLAWGAAGGDGYAYVSVTYVTVSFARELTRNSPGFRPLNLNAPSRCLTIRDSGTHPDSRDTQWPGMYS